ncbi:MAG: sulfatase-like hydrolase/transferase [Alistipes shahii]
MSRANDWRSSVMQYQAACEPHDSPKSGRTGTGPMPPRIAEYERMKGRVSQEELTRWKYQQYMKDYCAVIKGVDENVGRLLDYLEEIGELDNTIIVYTSDQGFFLGEHGWFDKRFMYEECQRTPLAGALSESRCGGRPHEGAGP